MMIDVSGLPGAFYRAIDHDAAWSIRKKGVSMKHAGTRTHRPDEANANRNAVRSFRNPPDFAKPRFTPGLSPI